MCKLDSQNEAAAIKDFVTLLNRNSNYNKKIYLMLAKAYENQTKFESALPIVLLFKTVSLP